MKFAFKKIIALSLPLFYVLSNVAYSTDHWDLKTCQKKLESLKKQDAEFMSAQIDYALKHHKNPDKRQVLRMIQSTGGGLILGGSGAEIFAEIMKDRLKKRIGSLEKIATGSITQQEWETISKRIITKQGYSSAPRARAEADILIKQLRGYRNLSYAALGSMALGTVILLFAESQISAQSDLAIEMANSDDLYVQYLFSDLHTKDQIRLCNSMQMHPRAIAVARERFRNDFRQKMKNIGDYTPESLKEAVESSHTIAPADESRAPRSRKPLAPQNKSLEIKK